MNRAHTPLLQFVLILSLITFLSSYSPQSVHASNTAASTSVVPGVVQLGGTSINEDIQKLDFDDYFKSLQVFEQERIRMILSFQKKVVSIIAGDSDEAIEDYLHTSAYGAQAKGVTGASTFTHGTGFIVDPKGIIVTNKHVVMKEDAIYKAILSDGTPLPISKISLDPVFDIAIIEVTLPKNTALESVQLLDKQKLPFIGQIVFSIGNTLGKYPLSTSEGIISERGRSVTAYGDNGTTMQLIDLLQTDANISLGNSGGPLIDSKGTVVGMTTAFDQDAENLGFAIPTKYISSALDAYKKYGKITTPYLGVRYFMLNEGLQQKFQTMSSKGAYIVTDSGASPAIIPGSPAARAGLLAGDIILSVQGTPLHSNMSLAQALGLHRAEKNIVLFVQRGNQKKRFVVDVLQR